MSDKEMAARPETIATTSSNQQADVIAQGITPVIGIGIGIGVGGGSGGGTPNEGSDRDGTKIAAILRVFVRPLSLNRFEAERHHDHCLHTTVATLEGYGITIGREWEKVPCLRGRKVTRCKRYWLDNTPENLLAANNLLAVWGYL